MGSTSHTGFLCLLAGMVLQLQRQVAEAAQRARLWSSNDLRAYQATYAFNYIICGTYLIFWVVLLLANGTMTQSKGVHGACSRVRQLP